MDNQYLKQQMKQTKPLELLLKLALPAMAAQLLNALYNIVDRVFIGHIEGDGTLALSGLGICFPIISLVTAFSWLIGMGGAPLLSISLGEKKEKRAQEIEETAILMLIIIGVILTVVCQIFAEPILLLFGASEQLLSYSVTYFRVYMSGAIAVMITMGMNPFINAQGRTTLGTMTILIGAVLNIILDWLFIYNFQMGIFGAALATVISQIVSAAWVLWLLLFSSKIEIKINVRSILFRLEHVKKIISLGVSSFVFMANESLVAIILNRLIRLYKGYGNEGDLYIGALTIVTSVFQLFLMPLQGITQGAQPITGYCKGAGLFERLEETLWDARIIATISATLFWIVFMFYPSKAAGLFTSDAELLKLSAKVIRISLWVCFVFGFQMINQHSFVAMGNAKYSFLFAIMRKVLLLIPIACILPLFLGVNGIFLAESISTIITAIVTHIVFTKYLKRQKVALQG